jgi:hypothetical protein
MENICGPATSKKSARQQGTESITGGESIIHNPNFAQAGKISEFPAVRPEPWRNVAMGPYFTHASMSRAQSIGASNFTCPLICLRMILG